MLLWEKSKRRPILRVLFIPSSAAAKGTLGRQTSLPCIYMLVLDSKLSIREVMAEDLKDDI